MKNSFLYEIKDSLEVLLKELKPVNKGELCVLICSVLYFSVILSLLITISFPKGDFMEFMGYDTDIRFATNPIMMSSGGMLKWNIRHPLYTLFYLPVIVFNELLLYLGIDITRQLFMFVSVFIMGYSCLILYKIFRFIKLSIWTSLIHVFFFCSFAHIILLSFQVDSFVISMFFLLIMILLFLKRKNNLLIDNILFLGLTGTTSTNMIKFGICQLIEEKSFHKTIKRFFLSIPLFLLVLLVTLPDLYYRLSLKRGLVYAFIGDTLTYTGSTLNKFCLFVDNFVSEPIAFHNTMGIVYSPDTIHLPPYTSFLCYLPTIIIFFFVFLSLIVCHKERIIWLFCTCWGADLIIHFGIGYGIEEAQLFSGHWIFFLPILIGMLIVRSNKLLQRVIVGVVSVVASILMVYNLNCFIHSL